MDPALNMSRESAVHSSLTETMLNKSTSSTFSQAKYMSVMGKKMMRNWENKL